MKLQGILDILVICQILCYIMFTRIFCISLDFGKDILISYQNHFFMYFDGFKCLVYYNLVVCYSLDPVLVIWYVSLSIFS